MGVRHSNAAFSKLMMRLMVGNFVDPCPTTHTTDGQTIRENRYEITDVGVLEWTAARKFYLNLSPPSADLVPLTTEQEALAAYDAEIRQRIITDRAAKTIKQFAWAILKSN